MIKENVKTPDYPSQPVKNKLFEVFQRPFISTPISVDFRGNVYIDYGPDPTVLIDPRPFRQGKGQRERDEWERKRNRKKGEEGRGEDVYRMGVGDGDHYTEEVYQSNQKENQDFQRPINLKSVP